MMKKELREKMVRSLILFALFLTAAFSWGQTPIALPASPYSENFNTTPGTSGTAYPGGWTSYNGTTQDAAMVVGTGTSTAGANYNYVSRIGLLGSGSAFLPSSLVLAFTNTSGKTNLKISYDIIKIREEGRSNSFNLEVSTTSAIAGFTAVTGGAYVSGTIAAGTSTPYANIDLSALDNKTGNVWIRWSYVEIGGSGSRDGLALDNVSLSYSSGTMPTVSTTTASSVTAYAATSGGNITAAGTANVTARGVVWTTSSTIDPTITTNTGMTSDGSGTGVFASSIANLLPNTTYYYRAYATSSVGTNYGSKLNFTTQAIPTVTTSTPATNITAASATAGGNATAQGTSAITEKGVVWSTAQTPTIALTTKTTDGTGTGAFTSSITGLAVNTTYYYRAYATNTQGTAYGAQSSFTTLNIAIPTVITTTFAAQNDAGVNTADLKGSVTSNGGAVITGKGFIYNSTGTNLTVGETTTITDEDDTDAAFTTAIAGLNPNMQYFYRAYAVNSAGTGYGGTNNFYTHAATPGAPGVINATFNTLDVTLNANQNPDVTQYVIRVLIAGNTWYVNNSGSLQDTPSWLTGSTIVAKTVTGLAPGTTYIFDMKARNASNIETLWSSTTAAQTVSPSTPYFSLIESDLDFGQVCINTYSQGYFIFKPNNVPANQQIAIYTLEGFSYSLTENGIYGTGLFITYTGQENITVYVRFTPTAVQDYPVLVEGTPGTININSAGTGTLSIPAYGEGVNTPASVATGSSGDITTTSVMLTAQLTQGCPAITAYGIEYSLTIGFANGAGTQVAGSNLAAGNYSIAVAALTACTPYYYKAYVTDATGTYYGAQQTFTTLPMTAPVTATAGTITQTSFTANWDAVPGATGYYLDVSTSPSFETVFLSEDFTGVTVQAGDPNIATTLNNYTNTTGWTGTNVYAEAGNIRVGAASVQGNIATPTLNLTPSAGVATLSFRAKHNAPDTTNKSIRVQYSSTGPTNFIVAPIGEFTLTENFATYTVPLTAGSATTRFRIQALASSANRFQVDDVKVSYSQLLAGYDNLQVSGTSHVVSGLDPNTTYYYRVRAYGGCTSGNSNVTEVKTLTYLTLGETDLAFGNVCTNAEGNGSFTFTGANMAGATLNIAALTGYSYSVDEDGTYTPTLPITEYNGAETTVYVKLTPTAVQAYNGNIVITGQGAYAAATLSVPVTGAGIYTPSATTVAAATGITMVSATLPGKSVASNCSATTAYGIEYNTINNFANGTATQLAGTNIDDNGDFSVSLENGTACTVYYFRAYTTNSIGTTYSSVLSFTTTSIGEPVAIAADEIAENGFTANWQPVAGATGYRLDVSTNPEFGTGNFGTDLIISEYVEGTSNNKALEIYNGTGAAVNLANYSLRQQANGAGAFGSPATYLYQFPSVTLPAGSVFVVKSSGAVDLTIASGHPGNLTATLAYSDTNGGIVVHFTGNDAVGLFKGSTMIDIVGPANNTSAWGTDLTLRRKAAILSPVAAYNAAQWDTFATNNSGLGAHTFSGGLVPSFVTGYANLNVPGNTTSAAVTGLGSFTKYYYRVRAYSANCTTGDSNTITVTTKGAVTWKIDNGTAKWIPAFYADGTTPLVIDETVATVIETNYNTGTNGEFTSKSIKLNNGILTVAAGTSLTVANEIVNNQGADKFIVENNGNLIQDNDTANTGAITVRRNGSPLYKQDYTMWSSPVAGQNLFNFSPVTLTGRFYTYDTANDYLVAIPGLGLTSQTTFDTGRGYLIRMPNGGLGADGLPSGTTTSPAAYQQGTAPMTFNGKFTGVPNNGTIPVALSDAGNGYNLVGNPYPSPIVISDFRTANQDVIDGSVWIYRKTNLSTNSAYVTVNGVGIYTGNDEPEQEDPNNIIRTGQGFIVKVKANNIGTQLVFNNGMRSDDTSNQFFRNAHAALPESHGIWLNVTNAAGFFSQMYTGYIAGATAGADNGIDSEYINDKSTVLSSVINNKEYIIHGRALPFSPENTEPLQFRSSAAGNYIIAIDHLSGLYEAMQSIYLKDNLTGALHNLKESAYSFATLAGTFSTRFEIVYTNSTLGNDESTFNETNVIIYKNGSGLTINSGNVQMKSVAIYDVRGRMLYNRDNINAAETAITDLQSQQQVLIVQITTTGGLKVSRKIAY